MKCQRLNWKKLVKRYLINGTQGYSSAMATKGGVNLDQVSLSTMELKKYPGIYIIGEALDIDGDTGGYNIQFAFSSAYVCAKAINGSPL